MDSEVSGLPASESLDELFQTIITRRTIHFTSIWLDKLIQGDRGGGEYDVYTEIDSQMDLSREHGRLLCPWHETG